MRKAKESRSQGHSKAGLCSGFMTQARPGSILTVLGSDLKFSSGWDSVQSDLHPDKAVGLKEAKFLGIPQMRCSARVFRELLGWVSKK